MTAGGWNVVPETKEKVMKQRKMILIALAALGITLGAPAARAADIAVTLGNLNIDFDFGPPPQRVEPTPAPRFGHVWAPGYWRAEGRRHDWVAGRWLEARRDHAWVADRWTPVGQRWRHEPGHWERHNVERVRYSHRDETPWRGRDGERRARYQ